MRTYTQKSKWYPILEMLCALGNHSVIHTSSCKRVHEFASNHCECDSGNVIWKKTRLGFGIRTKIRMASEIRFPAKPHSTPLFFCGPLLIGEDLLAGGDTPPLRDRFSNLLLQVKAYFLYMRTNIVPLSCFFHHLAVSSCLVFYLEAFLS